MPSCGKTLSGGGKCTQTLNKGVCPNSGAHKPPGNTNKTRAEDRNQSFNGEAHAMQTKKGGNSTSSGGGSKGR